MVKVSRQTVSKIARATSNEQRATTKPVMRSRTICQQCLHSLHHQIRKDLRHTPRPLASVFTQPKCSSFQSRPLFIHTRSHASVAAAAPAAPEQTSPRQDTSSHSEKQQIESNDEDELFRFYDSKASCETLFKECASQADYIVPQAFERKGKIPKTAAGEDVGEGSGWWYDCEFDIHLRCRHMLTGGQPSNSCPPSTPGPKSPSSTCTSSPCDSATSPPKTARHGNSSFTITSSGRPNIACTSTMV